MTTLRDVWASLTSSVDAPVYVLIDSAGLPRGYDGVPLACFAELECLFTGELAEELRNVAPYLGRTTLDAAPTDEALAAILNEQVAMLLIPGDPETSFGQMYRHLRKFNVVYGPDGNPLFFRYYDARVILDVLSVLDGHQIESFFGPIDHLVLVDSDGGAKRCRHRNGSIDVY